MKNNSEGTLPWGRRFGDLVNALLDLGVRVQSVKYQKQKPNRAKFVVRPLVRFIMNYGVEDCPTPGMIHIEKLTVVFPIGRLDVQDKLDQPVSSTAQQIVDWAKGHTHS